MKRSDAQSSSEAENLKKEKNDLSDIDGSIENACAAFSNLRGRCRVVTNPILLFKKGSIVWLGPKQSAPRYSKSRGFKTFDAGRGLIIPGLVDCHTHLVFSGNREDEFFLRNQGASYLEIAKRGGGILSTVKAVRATSRDTLAELARARLNRALSFGVTTIEIKSGYGLDTKNEIKMLEVIRSLSKKTPMTIVPTLLAAHAFAPPYRGSREGEERYVDFICSEIIPEVARQRLAVFNDVFLERGFFDRHASRRVLERGLEFGLRPKVHADELAHSGGSQLGASIGAISVDHCDHIARVDMALLARKGVTAVLLPGVSFFLNEGRYAPAGELLAHGVEIAIATDFNPGSCMTQNLLLMATLAAIYMKLEAQTIFRAMTYGAAKALGLERTKGSLEAGYDADVVVLNVPNLERACYHFGENHVRAVFIKGKRCL